MGERDYTGKQIVQLLRRIDTLVSRGATVSAACRDLGVVQQTYYKWRGIYGSLGTARTRRMKDLERENERLRRLMRDRAHAAEVQMVGVEHSTGLRDLADAAELVGAKESSH
jgi:putative transposase